MKTLGRIAATVLLTVAGLAVAWAVFIFLGFLLTGQVHR